MDQDELAKHIRDNLPPGSPIQPVQLFLDSEIQFRCHKEISCFNACCKNIDITLTPYDILRLKRELSYTSQALVAEFTIPFEIDFHGMPGLKLATKPNTTECVFLREEGCSVYENRPAACRYYALGTMGVRPKGSGSVEDVYFVVKEPHCQGHFEDRHLTVGEYRQEQGVEIYDEMNREWRDIILKKRSSGPTVGKPSERSMQLFDMCSYDMDSFRSFIDSDGFQKMFTVPEIEMEVLRKDDEALLQFSMRFLKQVLFGEPSIPVREGAREQRSEERREHWEKRRKDEVAAHKAQDQTE